MQSPDSGTVLTVSELNARAKFLLEEGFAGFWIEGEVSGFNYSSLGHLYFTLKDDGAQVSCVLFKYQLARQKIVPKEGDSVRLSGRVSLYEPRGIYQIVVGAIELQGQGQLYQKYLELKEKLEKLGYFAPEHKKKIPFFPKRLGVITSPAGAALRDVITTLKRRMSQIEIIIYPALVQGEGSKTSIARALDLANRRREVEALILCRGGGSLEDLWAFNEEVVVEAVYQSELPVISGVGHETDFTLADFAADLRAPTPTAAAELASPKRTELLEEVRRETRELTQSLAKRYTDASQRLDFLTHYLAAPLDLVESLRRELARLREIIAYKTREAVLSARHELEGHRLMLRQLRPETAEMAHRLEQYQKFLAQALKFYLTGKKERVASARDLLQAMSPEGILERGFSIVTNQKREVVRAAASLKPKDALNIRFAQGEIKAVVQGQLDLFSES